jgi:hypothetical protein
MPLEKGTTRSRQLAASGRMATRRKGEDLPASLREASPTGRLRLRRSALFVVFRFSTENHANRRALKRMQGAVR